MNRFREAYNRNDFWMGAAAIVLGAYFLAKELTISRAPTEGGPWLEMLVAATGLSFGVVLLGGYGWARWLGLPWLAALAVKVVIDGIKLQWDLGALAGVGLLIILIAIYFGMFFAPRDDVK